MPKPIRLILADDHAVLRAGLRSFLEEQTDPVFQVVGEASDGTKAIELVEQHGPDILILDLSMPVTGGLETVQELRRRQNPVRILVLTQFSELIYFRRLFEAGINGYILKSARGDELISAIRSVMSSGTYIDPNIARDAMFAKTSDKKSTSDDDDAYQRLTPREQQILKLIAEGHSNKEIASRLDLAVKTVMSHRVNLMDKLGIHNHSKLVQFAIRIGIITVR